MKPSPAKGPKVVAKFKTGEAISESGIYQVVHAGHRLPHEVTLIRGSSFPPCAKCADAVEFELLRAVPYSPFKVTLYELPIVGEEDTGQASDAAKAG